MNEDNNTYFNNYDGTQSPSDLAYEINESVASECDNLMAGHGTSGSDETNCPVLTDDLIASLEQVYQAIKMGDIVIAANEDSKCDGQDNIPTMASILSRILRFSQAVRCILCNFDPILIRILKSGEYPKILMGQTGSVYPQWRQPSEIPSQDSKLPITSGAVYQAIQDALTSVFHSAMDDPLWTDHGGKLTYDYYVENPSDLGTVAQCVTGVVKIEAKPTAEATECAVPREMGIELIADESACTVAGSWKAELRTAPDTAVSILAQQVRDVFEEETPDVAVINEWVTDHGYTPTIEFTGGTTDEYKKLIFEDNYCEDNRGIWVDSGSDKVVSVKVWKLNVGSDTKTLILIADGWVAADTSNSSEHSGMRQEEISTISDLDKTYILADGDYVDRPNCWHIVEGDSALVHNGADGTNQEYVYQEGEWVNLDVMGAPHNYAVIEIEKGVYADRELYWLQVAGGESGWNLMDATTELIEKKLRKLEDTYQKVVLPADGESKYLFGIANTLAEAQAVAPTPGKTTITLVMGV